MNNNSELEGSKGRSKTSLSIDSDILRYGKIAASKDRRTLSNYIEVLIAKDMEKNNIEIENKKGTTK